MISAHLSLPSTKSTCIKTHAVHKLSSRLILPNQPIDISYALSYNTQAGKASKTPTGYRLIDCNPLILQNQLTYWRTEMEILDWVDQTVIYAALVAIIIVAADAWGRW